LRPQIDQSFTNSAGQFSRGDVRGLFQKRLCALSGPSEAGTDHPIGWHSKGLYVNRGIFACVAVSKLISPSRLQQAARLISFPHYNYDSTSSCTQITNQVNINSLSTASIILVILNDVPELFL
jgi:hypothetical protein